VKRALLWLAACVTLCFAQEGGDPPFLLEPGWRPLLNGRDTAGWRPQDPEKGAWTTTRAVAWVAAPDPKILTFAGGPGDRLVNGPEGRTSNIVTADKFGDLELYLEFLMAAKSNSGIYFHGLYEVQVVDSFGVVKLKFGDCGGIYTRLVEGKLVGGTPPRVNASRPPGQWQSFHIWFRAPRFDDAGRKTANARFLRVLLNGVSVQEQVEVDGPTHSAMPIAEAARNPLMLQGDHGPVAYRNIYVRPLRTDVKP
jgi:hypothetical protein